MTDGKDAALAVIAILHDPVRAKLFRFIRRRSRPVTREEAATAAGISRKLAAFHLDKLVDAGLLTAAYPVSARRTPGRPPKAYTAAPGEWQVSVPNVAMTCSRGRRAGRTTSGRATSGRGRLVR